MVHYFQEENPWVRNMGSWPINYMTTNSRVFDFLEERYDRSQTRRYGINPPVTDALIPREEADRTLIRRLVAYRSWQYDRCRTDDVGAFQGAEAIIGESGIYKNHSLRNSEAEAAPARHSNSPNSLQLSETLETNWNCWRSQFETRV